MTKWTTWGGPGETPRGSPRRESNGRGFISTEPRNMDSTGLADRAESGSEFVHHAADPEPHGVDKEQFKLG